MDHRRSPAQRHAGQQAPGAPQPRELVRLAFGPSLVALAILAAITLVQLVAASSDLTGTLGAVASMWLAVHLVPVTIAGQQLGVLPLVPAAAMVWAAARSSAHITPPGASWFVARWIVASAIGGPLLIAALSLAIVHDAASVITDLQTPNALQAFTLVLLVHGAGALIGVGSRLGHRVIERFPVPGWLTDTIRPALIAVLTLLALCTAAVAGSLVVHWSTMQQLFGITDSFFGQLSLTLLSLLYLPNVVLGAAAMAVGSSAHIGFATFSAFTVFGGDIPALPILAAAPTPPLGPVWVALLILGAVAGVALGQQCALKPLPPGPAFAKLAVASALAAVSLAVLAFAGGGLLGNFGHVGVDQTTFAPGAFFWFFVIGALTVTLAGGLLPRSSAPVVPILEEPAVEESSVEAEQPPLPEPPPAPPAPEAEDVEDVEDIEDVEDVEGVEDVEDVEDLMIVDADVDAADSPPDDQSNHR